MAALWTKQLKRFVLLVAINDWSLGDRLGLVKWQTGFWFHTSQAIIKFAARLRLLLMKWVCLEKDALTKLAS